MNTSSNPLRWLQRFQNFQQAVAKLKNYVGQNKLNELEQQGLIQAFEYTFELAWKTLQDLIILRGHKDIIGPRPVIEQCFKDQIIQDGQVWMEMLKDRNLTSHTYSQKITLEIVEHIQKKYLMSFIQVEEKLDQIQKSQNPK